MRRDQSAWPVEARAACSQGRALNVRSMTAVDRDCVKTLGVSRVGQKAIKNGALSRILRQLQGKFSPDFAYNHHLQESPSVFTQLGPKADMPAKAVCSFIGDMWHAG
jgi:hypothetical protein